MSIAGIWLGVSGVIGKERLARWVSRLREYTAFWQPISPRFTIWVNRNRRWLGLFIMILGIPALAYGLIPAIQAYFRQYPPPTANSEIPARCLIACLPILVLVFLSQATNPAFLLAPIRLALFPYQVLDRIVVRAGLESTLKVAGAILATVGLILLL